MNLHDVHCCFCNQTLSHRKAVVLDAYPNPERVEVQTFFAHLSCFSNTLHPAIPNMLNLLED